MDPWLNDEIKELLFHPCLTVSESIGRRLNNRLKMGQEIDERALTEYLVDSMDSSSSENVWGRTPSLLQDHGIYLNTHVQKSTRENINGADIGFVIGRSVHHSETPSQAQYAVLVQCKKIDADGRVADFFHQVGKTGPKQSSLMLDITPNSFYFIFTPPSILNTYCSIEPIAFAQARPGCSSPVWNSGSFGFDHKSLSFLSAREKAEATGILVVPALAVEAQSNSGTGIEMSALLPNCLPLWYWFGELLIPGFIGDRRSDVVRIATNTWDGKNTKDDRFGVRYSVSVKLGNG